ncbi:MAG: hypothetical protein RLY72_2698 [Planctomycetota bacterium]|jgi:hypothetical protein
MLADLYILQKPRAKAEGGGLVPLASRDELQKFFLTLNTASERSGSDVLYGPGIRIELPPMQDPVLQVTLTVTEDELFHILFFGTANEPRGRLLRATMERGWRFYDPVRSEYVPPYHDGDDDDDDDRFSSLDDDDDD